MNKNQEDIENTATQLLEGLNSESTQEEVRAVTNADPLDMLRSDILSFFRTHMERIRKQEDLRTGIQNQLQEMIDNGDLTFEQLMKLFSMVSNQENNAADSIISLFKPVPGVGSLLANSIGQDKKDDDVENMYENLSPEQMRSIDKLYRKLQEDMGG